MSNVSLASVERRAANPRNWGDLDEHDWKENEAALEHGFRLFSSYATPGGMKFYVITEHDRSVTTILLPEEY